MIFAFDVDGVITEMPEFYSVLIKSLKAQGHRIIILTNYLESFRVERVRDLASYGIEYDELIFTAEKKEYCIKNDIDYALDDNPLYYKNTRSHPIEIFSFNK